MKTEKVQWIGLLAVAVCLVGCVSKDGTGAGASSGLPPINIDGTVAGVDYVDPALELLKAAYPQYAALIPSRGGKTAVAAHPAAGIVPEVDWKWVGETREVTSGAKIAESDFQRETVWRRIDKPSAAVLVPVVPPPAVPADPIADVSDPVIDSLVDQYEALKTSQE